jgi:two-component system, chemotaxis family, protein-glutamate methylesterase/glutaminase
MLTAGPSSVRVVGIGASAGGLPALKAILGALPGDFPAALLVVLHLHPTMPSRLAWLLGRQAALPVRTAASGDAIAPGTVYVAVPNLHLMVEDRHLRLVPSAAVHHVRPSIDLLFASVARSYGADATAVVLTGTGLDGAAGIVAVKGAGGITVVQDPTEAAFAGMPSAAIATHCVDHVVPLVAIGPLLIRLAGTAAGTSV